MEDQGAQTNGKKVVFLLVGTAAVALAAAYYSKRHSASKRPANSQQPDKLQTLLAQVFDCYIKSWIESALAYCVKHTG